MVKFFLLALVIFNLSLTQAADTKKASSKRKVAAQITDADVKEKAKQFQMGCNEDSDIDVEKIVNKYRFSYEKPTEPEREAVFYSATCFVGAYNQTSMVFFNSHSNFLEAISFATPMTNSKSEKIIGWYGSILTGGLSYDANKKLLVSYSKGRGLGDISESATYAILENMVVLRKYELDRTEDEKINPKVIYEATEPLVR